MAASDIIYSGDGFTATGTLYAFADAVSWDDVTNQLTARIAQLAAMLAMTHGNARQAFQALSDDTNDDHMWGCTMAADECAQLALKLATRKRNR